MPFGQLVIGPPGSGKSTYCYGMYQFLQAIGRKPSVVNLDPANDHPSYPCALDIRDFASLEEVMEEQQLGPNGGIVAAMEAVEEAADSFIDQLQKLGNREYVIFDCPGQVELYTHHSALRKVFLQLGKDLDYRLAVIHLVDSQCLTSASYYISVLLLALRAMLQLDLPHINVLSKIDLVAGYGPLPFDLNYYAEARDLDRLLPVVEKEFPGQLASKYAKLTEAIAQVVEDFGLVEFEVLAVEDKRSMISLLQVIDKANGYLFGTTEIGGDTIWAEATRGGGYVGVDIQERWIDYKEEYDEAEREAERQAQEEQQDGEGEGTGPDQSMDDDVDPEERQWREVLAQYEREHGRSATKSNQ